MRRRPFHHRFIKHMRDIRSKAFIDAARELISGDVVDVGGGDFYLTAKKSGFKFRKWVTLEVSQEHLFEIQRIQAPEFSFVLGDGCRASEVLHGRQFDSLINAQVLEHVMRPDLMIKECSKLLKQGGYGIFLIPQTSVIHMAPEHYFNFTRFWIEKVMGENQLKIVKLKPLGGLWSTQASHLFYFFLKVIRLEGYSFPEARRNIFFWLMLPLMTLYALISLPLVLLFSLGDLHEEPNNYLVVAEKE